MSIPFSIETPAPIKNLGPHASESLLQLNPEKDRDIARSLQNLQFLIRHYGLPYQVTVWPSWDRFPNRSYIRASWKSTHGVINWKFRNLNWDGQNVRSSSMKIEESQSSETTLSEAVRATQELIQTLQLPITLPKLPIQVDYRGLHLNEEAIIFDRSDSGNIWIKSTKVVCPDDSNDPINPATNVLMKRYREQYNAYVVANADVIPHGTYIVVIDAWRKGLAYISHYNGPDSQNYVLLA